MNFFDALDAHLSWKQRLRRYLEGQLAEDLQPEAVGCEDGCDLGRWIRSTNGSLRHLPEFRKMRELHADFHRCAAEVVEAVKSGDPQGAEQAFSTEFSQLSAMVVKSITKLSRSLDEKISHAA